MDKPDPAELTNQFNQVMSGVLDMMVRIVALQVALVKNGILHNEQIETEVRAIHEFPAIKEARRKYGDAAISFDTLLRDYQGPLQ